MKIKWYLYTLISIAVLALRCGVNDPEATDGSLRIVLVKESPRNALSNATVALEGVQTIVKKGAITVYNNSLPKQGSGFHGKISGLETGNDYSVLLYGKNRNAEIILRVYESGIIVRAGEESKVNMVWSEFIPTQNTPADTNTITNTTPIFGWSDVVDASAYELVVDNSLRSSVIHETNLTSSNYTATSILSDDTYYWKVRAKDSNGNWGGWSTPTWSFTVDTQGPVPPTLISPPNGFTISDNTPIFDWSDVGDALAYAVMVDSSVNFSSPAIHETNLTGSIYTATSSLLDGIYFWKVRARDGNGNWGSWTTPPWSFIITETYSVYGVSWTNTNDRDGDDYSSNRNLNFDVDVSSGTHSIYAKVYYKTSSSSSYSTYYTTPDFSITGNSSSDSHLMTVGVPNLELTHDTYDFQINIYQAGTSSPVVATMGPSDDSDLNDQRFETARQDMPVVWQDDFEAYPTGSFPSAWTPDANADESYIDNTTFFEGTKSLRQIGSLGGCWAALAYRPLTVSPPFEIEFAVRNGNESLSGCHQDRASIGIRKGFSWSAPARRWILFRGDGTIIGGINRDLGTYTTLTWYTVRIRYERPSTSEVKLSFWINDTFLGSETIPPHPEEDTLTNLELTVQEGTVWFDAVKVFQ